MTKVTTGNRRIIVFLMGTAHLIASMGIGIGIGFIIGYNKNGSHPFQLSGVTTNDDKAEPAAELHSRRKTIAKGLPTGALLRGKDITFNPTANTVSETRPPVSIPSTAPSLSPSSEHSTSSTPTPGSTDKVIENSQSNPTRSPSAKCSKSPVAGTTADNNEISQSNPTQTPSAKSTLIPSTDKPTRTTTHRHSTQLPTIASTNQPSSMISTPTATPTENIKAMTQQPTYRPTPAANTVTSHPSSSEKCTCMPTSINASTDSPASKTTLPPTITATTMMPSSTGHCHELEEQTCCNQHAWFPREDQERVCYKLGCNLNECPKTPSPSIYQKPTSAPVKTNTSTSIPQSSSPTMSRTDRPTMKPVTWSPSKEPSSNPTESPSAKPVTSSPSQAPSSNPTEFPSAKPVTSSPSQAPSSDPTQSPSPKPTTQPTSSSPTDVPSAKPTSAPTHVPTTPSPTIEPSASPTTVKPTLSTLSPSANPSSVPPFYTPLPTKINTHGDTLRPTSNIPTYEPTTTVNKSLSPSTAPVIDFIVLPPTSQPTVGTPDPTIESSIGGTPTVSKETSAPPTTHPRRPEQSDRVKQIGSNDFPHFVYTSKVKTECTEMEKDEAEGGSACILHCIETTKLYEGTILINESSSYFEKDCPADSIEDSSSIRSIEHTIEDVPVPPVRARPIGTNTAPYRVFDALNKEDDDLAENADNVDY